PPARPRSNRRAGAALASTLDRYLQLISQTWSTRRSAGTTSSPGARVGPFHSTRRGGRPRSPSSAWRKWRPLAQAAANSWRCWPPRARAARRAHTSSATLATGRAASAESRSAAPAMARPVTISVISVFGDGTAADRRSGPPDPGDGPPSGAGEEAADRLGGAGRVGGEALHRSGGAEL